MARHHRRHGLFHLGLQGLPCPVPAQQEAHAQVVRIIKEWKAASGKETPESMQMVWDWEHGKIVDTVSRIKAMLEMYKK